MTHQISFHVNKSESITIREIVQRALPIAKQHGLELTPLELTMDITATHANGCPLKLTELASAPQVDFVHDVFGIYRHLDRKSGHLKDCFLPRYSL